MFFLHVRMKVLELPIAAWANTFGNSVFDFGDLPAGSGKGTGGGLSMFPPPLRVFRFGL